MSKRKLKIKGGVDDLLKDLTVLTSDTERMISAALYDGAGLIFKSYKAAAQSIPTDDRVCVRGNARKFGLTPAQKAGIVEAVGIAKFRTEAGEVNTKIGIDGYNSVVTKRWPKGQPNVVVARGLVNGTSWLRPYDFPGKAKRAVKAEAERKMAETLKNEFAKRTK